MVVGLSEARRHWVRAFAGVVLMALACSVSAANTAPAERGVIESCLAHQAQRFNIDPKLLRAIAYVESRFNPRAVSPAGAIGLMQINPTWLPALAKYGIFERDLYDPCTSAEVGAWILSQLFLARGPSWIAVGAYNAACTVLKGDDCTRARTRYAWQVYQAQTPATLATADLRPVAPLRRAPGIVALSSLTPQDANSVAAPKVAREATPAADAPTPAPAVRFAAATEDDDE